MTRKISIVGIQTVPTSDKEVNLKEALALVDDALSRYKYVDVLVLPEYFYQITENKDKDQIGPYPKEVEEAFSLRARTFNTYIVAGTVPNLRNGKYYNTAVLFDRQGKIVGSYDKIHLFDVLDAVGEEQESHVFEHGDHLFTYDADFGKIGVIICYDIRFPEMARTLALQGLQYLFAPAAFYSPRIDHCTDLLRATALQNSMYVTGVNLFGKWNPSNIFCGRSLIADPWGISVAAASDKACFFQAYVDRDYPDKVKDAVGSFHNRVPSLYNIPKE